MPANAKWCGRLLIAVGLVGYIYGVYLGAASWTALIPGFFGVVLMGLGHLAPRTAEGTRKHVMHAAVLVALIGFIAASGRLLPRLADLTLSAATISQVVMAVICLVFIVLSVRSFAAARSGRG